MSSWHELALTMARRYDAWPPIVLATVEAETGGRNVMGDGGSAYGYGQVWPRWWQWAFDQAAVDQGITLGDDPLELTVLQNDAYSMAVAVKVIKSVWDRSAGADLEDRWVNFTKSYVGPAIPAADLERRRAIWSRYKAGMNVPETGGSLPPIQVTKTAQNAVTVSLPEGMELAGRLIPIVLFAAAGLFAVERLFGRD